MRSVANGVRGQRLKRSCLFVIAALALTMPACGDSSSPGNPTAPDGGIDAAALAGSWSGTVATLQGTGTLRLELVGPDGERYSGTWSAVFADTALNGQGTLLATVTSTTVGVPRLPMLDVTLTPIARAPCDLAIGERMYLLRLGVTARNRMVGEGEFGGCGGQINLARVQLSR